MFTQSPYGYVKGNSRGHHLASRTPQSGAMDKMKQENTALKALLDAQVAALTDLAAKVEELAAKKGKK